MDNKTCPRCKSAIDNDVLYKCVRCFTVYCKNCEKTIDGRLCPKCGMSQRMVLNQDRQAK